MATQPSKRHEYALSPHRNLEPAEQHLPLRGRRRPAREPRPARRHQSLPRLPAAPAPAPPAPAAKHAARRAANSGESPNSQPASGTCHTVPRRSTTAAPTTRASTWSQPDATSPTASIASPAKRPVDHPEPRQRHRRLRPARPPQPALVVEAGQQVEPPRHGQAGSVQRGLRSGTRHG